MPLRNLVRSTKYALIAGLGALLAMQGPAIAQSGTFTLELNSVADADDACRLTFVATNNTGVGLTTTSYEMALFDSDGVVASLLVLEFGALPVAKTKVVQFDLDDTKCRNISRIVVNDAAECVAGEEAVPLCLEALVASTRTDVDFGV